LISDASVKKNVSALISSQAVTRQLFRLHPCEHVAIAMDVEATMRLHTEIFREGGRQTQDVNVKLDKDWFRVERCQRKPPNAITVRRYWDTIKQPTESTTAFRQLYSIKRALIDWPLMGAAIGKLAQQEFNTSQGALKRLKDQTIRSNSKMLRTKLDKATDIIKEKSLGKSINSDKKKDGKQKGTSNKMAVK
jgi:hypothetical protein